MDSYRLLMRLLEAGEAWRRYTRRLLPRCSRWLRGKLLHAEAAASWWAAAKGREGIALWRLLGLLLWQRLLGCRSS